MGIFHFLNVGQGDCSIIEHASGRVTVVDVNHAKPPTPDVAKGIAEILLKEHFAQKGRPTNPIEYMQARGIDSVFRFVLSHPDMDHMGGLKTFFETFAPPNFWDTDNTCEKSDWNGSPYNREDWEYYRRLRAGTVNSVKRLLLNSGAKGSFYNEGSDTDPSQDGLHILAPTPELQRAANDCDDYNDASYVILYRSNAGRILLAGDSHDETWKHVLRLHAADVTDVDVLLAPHHGRHSDRDFSFLDVVRPKLTLFGNASSEHLAYSAWSRRGLPIITNNQAGDVIIDTNGGVMLVYVTNESFARARNLSTFWDPARQAWYLQRVGDRPQGIAGILAGLR